MRCEYAVVDAFTRRRYAGNPCAVVFDADELDGAAMQRVAREMNLSETAFVVPSERAAVGVRYFTPVGEIPLAGHPTIATAHALVERGRLADNIDVAFEMPVGVIPVSIADVDGAVRYTMTQPSPQFFGTRDRAWAAGILGLHVDDVSAAPPPQIVSTGTPFLLVPLASRDALNRASHPAQLSEGTVIPSGASESERSRGADVEPQSSYFGIHVFARADDAPHAFEARQFAPLGDVPEDPVTGSACGALACYAVRYGTIDRTSFTIAQGAHVGRPGVVFADVLGSAGALSGVRIGGYAVSVAEGWIEI